MTISHSPARPLRIGTRASKLARWQADWVATRLRELGQAIEIVEITTGGDAEASAPISTFGGTGVFTKEIQRSLLAGNIDVAVHSMKDLPTDEVQGLVVSVVPLRESVADVLVANEKTTLQGLPAGAQVGTGSLRRQAQLKHVRPDLRISEIRGNVDTRLRKLDDGQFDAIVLAEAGLTRLGVSARISQKFSPREFLPAIGQGALAIECRSSDAKTQAALAPLDDAPTHAAVTAERALLAQLRGGCLAPVGAWGRIEDGTLQLSAVVLSPDGARRLDANASLSVSASEAVDLGRKVADSLLAQGAAELIAAARQK